MESVFMAFPSPLCLMQAKKLKMIINREKKLNPDSNF